MNEPSEVYLRLLAEQRAEDALPPCARCNERHDEHAAKHRAANCAGYEPRAR